MEGDQQKTLDRPDYTRVQVAAVAQAVIAAAVAFGVPISDQQSVALVALAGVIGTVLIGADAAIRRERARNADKLVPQASVTRKERRDGVETKAEVTAPVGDFGIQQFHAALREFLSDNGLVLAPAPHADQNGSRRRRAAARR